MDFHARNYMPDLGKWMSPDPLAEEYSSWSPYNFVMNSPLRFIDPTGMFIEPPSQPGEIEGDVHFDEDTGASYVWDGEGGWHSNMQGVEELDEVVITNEDSSGNDNEYSQVVTNIEYTGGGGAIEYIGGGGIIKGVSLLRNAKVAGWVKGLFGGGKAAEKGKELFKFGGSAGRHMENPSRVVPVQILEQAIKGSKGVADPKGSRALMHTTEMFKNGKTYNLEVLYDKGTNTIWHFKYWSK